MEITTSSSNGSLGCTSSTDITPQSLSNEKMFTYPSKIDYSNIKWEAYFVPKDIDRYWASLGCPVSYIEILEQMKNKESSEIEDIIFYRSQTPLSSSFHKLIEYFSSIFQTKQILPFLSKLSLNIQQLLPLMTQQTHFLFSSVLHMLQIILPKLKFHEDQQKALSLFSQWLIPKDIIHNDQNKITQEKIVEKDDNIDPNRINMNEIENNGECLLFLPVQNGRNHLWLILNRDKSLIISSIEGTEIRAQRKDYSVNQGSESVAIGTRMFNFLDSSQYMFFLSGPKATNPLQLYIESFKYAAPFLDKLSPTLKKIFVEMLSEPNMLLAETLFSIPTYIFSREVFLSLQNCLINGGMFAPFIQHVFYKDVENASQPATLFRGNNAATVSASTILNTYAGHIADHAIEQIIIDPNDAKKAVKTIIREFQRVPIVVKFIFSCAFHATASKFPEEQVPLITVGSLLIFRLVMPKMIQVPSISQLSKHIMNSFFLMINDPEISDPALVEEITKFILNLISLDNQAVTMNSFDFLFIAKHVAENNTEIVKKLQEIIKSNQCKKHPLVPSFIEMLENCFLSIE